jgi:multisubunit Na+/H+ antiporter MnhF subunit
MTGYLICAGVLVVGGLGPALFVSSRGSAIDRMVGLELISSIVVLTMLVIAQITQLSYYLAVPLVLAPLSFAGTLVYTRLLGRREGSS